MAGSRKNFLDRFFQIKLNEPQLAPDEPLWTEIEKRLEEKKRRRRWFFLLLFAGMLTGAIVSFFYLEKSNTSISEKPIAEKSEVSNSNSTSILNDEKKTESGNKLADKKETEKISSDKMNTQLTNTDSAHENHSEKNTLISSSPVNTRKKETTSAKTGLPVQTSKEPTSKASAIAKNANKTGVKENEEQHEEDSKVKNELSMAASEERLSTVQEHVDTTKKEEMNEQSASSENDSLAKSLTTENPVHKIDSIANKTTALPSATAATKPVDEPKQTFRFFTDIYVNYQINHRTIATSGQVDSLYSTRRKNEEKVRNTFNYGIHFGIQLSSFQLLSGIGITQYLEDIEYDSRANCYFIKNTGGFFNADSVWVYTYDSTKVEQQNDSIAAENGNKKSTFLEVPVNIFYRIPVSDFYFEFGGGISAMFPLKWNASYLNKEVTALENPSEIKMMQNVVWNLQLSGGIEFPLAKNLHAVLNLEYHRNLNSIFKGDYFLDQRYQSFGAQLSIRYWFGK